MRGVLEEPVAQYYEIACTGCDLRSMRVVVTVSISCLGALCRRTTECNSEDVASPAVTSCRPAGPNECQPWEWPRRCTRGASP